MRRNNNEIKPLDSALIAMSEHIEKYCDDASEHQMQQALEAAREAAMQKAIMKLTSRFKGQRLVDEAHDAANEVVAKLAAPPTGVARHWIEFCKDALRDSKELGERGSGEGTFLKGKLYMIISNKVSDALQPLWKREQRSANIDIADLDQLCISNKVPNSCFGKKIERQLAVRSRCERVMELHDAFLDRKTYRGRPVRDQIGNWTPVKEWAGYLNKSDRPKDIPQRTVERWIFEVRHHIQSGMGIDSPGEPGL